MRHHHSFLSTLARHGALIVTSVFILTPFAWMLSLSLKPPSEIFEANFHFLPQHLYAVENYSVALQSTPMLRFILNGVIVCGGILCLQVFTAAPIAYALAKLHFRGRAFLFSVVLVGILIPSQVLAVPLFVLFYHIGVLDTYAGLILPSAVSPFAIFLLRQVFKTIPDDLIHAARLDGLSELSIVLRIMLPLAKGAIVAFCILSFVLHWNDLFWPSIVVRSVELATPPLGVIFFKSAESGTSYGPLMAGAVIIVAPLVVAFLVAQRWFIQGLMSGSVK